MKETSNINPQLKYPFRVEILIGMIFFWLLLWGIALYAVLPKPHYSFYEEPLVVVFAGIGSFLAGTLFLQGFIMIVTHWGKYNLIIDEEGLHGVSGVTFIAWSEVSSIGDKTIRYNALGQRVHFFTIRVRSLKKILQRERGYTMWMRRLGKSRDFSIANVKRKDIQSSLNDIQRLFSQNIRKNNIQIYDTTPLPK